jgi:hypothetical protein
VQLNGIALGKAISNYINQIIKLSDKPKTMA